MNKQLLGILDNMDLIIWFHIISIQVLSSLCF